MAVVNLYSKRQKKLRGELPDIYTYDSIEESLKVQIIHIIFDVIGGENYNGTSAFSDKLAEGVYKLVHDILCREYGKFELNGSSYYRDKIRVFILHTKDVERIIDVIELTFRYCYKLKNEFDDFQEKTGAILKSDDAINELNTRFKEHGLGYAFESGLIVRIDSNYVHSEITKSTISLLRNKKFLGANEEYLKAHEHYRQGRNKECLSECLKAFESTMKSICYEKGWVYKETDTSKKLIQICFQNGLVPTFTQNQFTSLLNLLESGIPTIRNKLGGHGQGQIPQKANDEVTRYGLNLTGTNIIFLIEQSGIC